jgi:heme oxygenase (mycobilin-producing)
VEHVVLINPFEVPADHEAEFLARWQEAADYLRRQDGFVSTRLHASLDPGARFRFVNVAVWRSPEHFRMAVGTEAFAQIARRMPFGGSPGLYRVAAE